MNAPPDIVLFFGRLHPVLVHLPIGFIVLLAALELLALFPRFAHANHSAGIILAMAAPVAVVTALCGWLLSRGGGYDTRLLWWHQWTGISTAAACLAAGFLYSTNRQRAYRWCLFSTLPLLLVASHFGGSLTHGSDYLFRYAPALLRTFLNGGAQPTPGQRDARQWPDLPVFGGIIQPVLQRDCTSCHGPEKAKAGLRLDSSRRCSRAANRVLSSSPPSRTKANCSGASGSPPRMTTTCRPKANRSQPRTTLP